jgi:hypothetical protein
MKHVLEAADYVLGTVWLHAALAVLVVAAFIVGLVLLVQVGRQRRRLALIFGRAENASFYERIDVLTRAFDQQTTTQQELRAACAALEMRSHDFFDMVNIERYDAFPGQAGQQSFSLLLLNRNGSGLILTSLISVQSGRVYAKSIKAWASETALSHEEEALLKRHARS